jgi:hypothetical protein
MTPNNNLMVNLSVALIGNEMVVDIMPTHGFKRMKYRSDNLKACSLTLISLKELFIELYPDVWLTPAIQHYKENSL